MCQMNPVETLPQRLRLILILTSHPYLDLSSVLIPYNFPAKYLYEFLISPTCATYPANLFPLYSSFLIMFGEEHKLLNSSLCNYHHSCKFLPLRSKYSLRCPIHGHNLRCSSLSMRDQVPYPYKIAGKMNTFIDNSH
jgi:hypothetical protein